MAFKLNAGVLSQKPGQKTGQSWPIYGLKSIGIWPGEELRDAGDSPEGVLTGITTKFSAMTKSKPKDKKPMTFSWSPSSREERVLFKSILRHRSFEMTVGVEDDNGNFLTLNFKDVKLIKTPIKRKDIEQVEATFMDFYRHP
ncbi:MAG: hypothetical protein R2747_11360 [Pyrinomonadaceae bacterium]